MVAASFPVPGVKRGARALRSVGRAVTKAVTPHRASLARLADMPLSVAGFGLVDFAAFHIAHGWGWLVTGASLFALEHLIADDE